VKFFRRLVTGLCVFALLGVAIGAPVSAQQDDESEVSVVVVFEDRSNKNPQAIEASGGRVTGGSSVTVAPVLFARYVTLCNADRIINSPHVIL